jgi:transcriptional regulator with XRE-family HTH domain
MISLGKNKNGTLHADELNRLKLAQLEREEEMTKKRLPQQWGDAQLKILGAYIAEKRKEKEMAQSYVESKCNLGPSKLSFIESGKFKGINEALVNKLAFVIGFDAEDLFLELERDDVMIATPATSQHSLFKTKEIKTRELIGKDFTLSYTINDGNIKIHLLSQTGVQYILFEGKKIDGLSFIAALKQMIKEIEKN